MATNFTATAPGKLVIAGEYAVLEGAPAIAAAVNKRAKASVTAAKTGELLIANTGIRFPFELGAGGQPVWSREPGDQGSVLAAVLAALAAGKQFPGGLTPWKIELCSRDFYAHLSDGSTPKLGIGSSAAVTVALTAALQCCAGGNPDLDLCLAAHRFLQDGGSGIDVATAWFGGVVLMQPGAEAVPAVRPLSWPAGLHIRPVWTGVSASTPIMLQRLAAFRQNSGTLYTTVMQRFGTALESILGHWQLEDAAALSAGLMYYGELLAEFDRVAEIGIWSDGHRRILDLARSMQVGYKPSGAGGGDFGLGFSEDQVRLDAFVHEVHAQLVPQTHGVEWGVDGVLINGRGLAATT